MLSFFKLFKKKEKGSSFKKKKKENLPSFLKETKEDIPSFLFKETKEIYIKELEKIKEDIGREFEEFLKTKPPLPSCNTLPAERELARRAKCAWERKKSKLLFRLEESLKERIKGLGPKLRQEEGEKILTTGETVYSFRRKGVFHRYDNDIEPRTYTVPGWPLYERERRIVFFRGKYYLLIILWEAKTEKDGVIQYGEGTTPYNVVTVTKDKLVPTGEFHRNPLVDLATDSTARMNNDELQAICKHNKKA